MIKIGIESNSVAAEDLAFLKRFFEIEVMPTGIIPENTITTAIPSESATLSRNAIKKKAQSFFTLPMASNQSTDIFYLLEQEQHWHLLDRELNYLAIDFDGDHLNYKRKAAGKKEVFFKALGTKTKKVLDLTGGLAIDSVFLARNGYKVETLERHPLVYFMLIKAQKLSTDPLIQAMKFHFAEASEFLHEKQASLKNFDAIYFDPMYPEKGKTALSRQEMQLFKSLVGKDQDAAEILQELRKCGPRIVVKRPIQGDSLDDKKVHEFMGKTVRYDIY